MEMKPDPHGRTRAVRIGFVLASGRASTLPSTRISVFNMLPHLRSANFEPEISFQPEVSTEKPDLSGVADRMIDDGVSVAYFQKVHGRSALDAVERLRSAGIRTVFGVCDLVEPAMVSATDATIAVTDFLRSQYPAELRPKIHVVHDGIEHPEYRASPSGALGTDKRLSAVLVTSSHLDDIPVLRRPPRFMDLTVVGDYPELASRMEAIRQWRWKFTAAKSIHARMLVLRRMCGRGFEVRSWNSATVYKYMLDADVAIIPVDMHHNPVENAGVSLWQVKSENRLTLSMALGLPVVASPVPAYLEVIEQGVNGFIATTRQDWLACLEALRDPALRLSMGEAARSTVIERFSMESQARKMIKVLGSLVN